MEIDKLKPILEALFSASDKPLSVAQLFELFVGDIGTAGSGPLAFIDGSTPSALAYSFVALGNSGDDIEFSNDSGSNYTYTPVPDADGYDSSVTHFRAMTSGAFAASDGINDPGFSFQFRVRLQ